MISYTLNKLSITLTAVKLMKFFNLILNSFQILQIRTTNKAISPP